MSEQENFGWDPELDDEDNLAHALGMCGCGAAEDVMRLFLRSLERMDDNSGGWPACCARLDNNFPQFADPKAPEKRNHDSLQHDLVWAHIYQLDHLGLTEHGTSAWTGWLTPKGKIILEKLRAYFAAQPKTEGK